jgi:nicotinate-nucleotide adenylyltransferase
MGTDAFFEIHTWKSYEEVLTQIPLIVIPRPMADTQYGFLWKAMEDYIKTKISSDYEYSKSRSCFLRINKPPIFVHEITAIQISSTMIRKLIKRGRSIDYLVPQKVAEFIKSKGLYL